jgi:uncharacterized protein
MTHVLDDDHLFFADIRSPRTVANIRRGSLVEVSVVDHLCERATGSGDRLSPTSLARTCTPRAWISYAKQGSGLVDRVVVIEVHEARPVVSPVYDDRSTTEADVILTFQARFARLQEPPSS